LDIILYYAKLTTTKNSKNVAHFVRIYYEMN